MLFRSAFLRKKPINKYNKHCTFVHDQVLQLIDLRVQRHTETPDVPGRLPLLPLLRREGDFFLPPQIHLALVASPDPSSSAGRSGGGRAGDPRSTSVHSVGVVGFAVGGAMEWVGSPAVVLVQVRVPFGDGARWSSAPAISEFRLVSGLRKTL